MFSALILFTYCVYCSKNNEILYAKLAKYSDQMRLFQRNLTAKVSNIGGCSKTLKTDKDVSYKSWLDFKQLTYSEDASEAI